jgi:hypothetical protein
MRIVILILSFIAGIGISNAQKPFKSLKRYSLIIPIGYEQINKIGSNVDLKLINKKSGVVFVVVVSPLTQYEKGKSIYDLTKIPPNELMRQMKEYTNNPTFVKYGNTKIDNIEASYLQYTDGANSDIYVTIYYVYYKEKAYVFNATCSSEDIIKLRPEIYNIFRSIKFN